MSRPVKPAHELLGEMLLELGEPALALQEFEALQQTESNGRRRAAWAVRSRSMNAKQSIKSLG
jgi:hypothetical protein